MNKEEVAKLIESIPQGLDQDDFLVALANKAAEVEREACAKMLDEVPDDDVYLASQYAEAIRSRSDK